MTDGEVARLSARIDEQDRRIQKLTAGLCETAEIVHMMAEKVHAQNAVMHTMDSAMRAAVAALANQTRVVAPTPGSHA
jgi:hypothetical protein